VSGGGCKVCNSSKRFEIELKLATCQRKDQQGGGDSVGSIHRSSFERIARKYKIGRMSLQRHWRNHVSDDQKRALIVGPGVDLLACAEIAAEKGLTLYEAIEQATRQFHHRMNAELAAGRTQSARLLFLSVIAGARFLAQLNGDLQRASSHITNNLLVLQSPLVVDIKSMLNRKLAPHPAALRDVMQGFEELAETATRAAPPLPALEAPRVI